MPDTSQTSPELLTAEQVADKIGVGYRTVWRLVGTEGFPQPIRFNKRLIRWKAADLQRYIDSLPPTPSEK